MIPPPPAPTNSEKRARFQVIWDQMCDPQPLQDSQLSSMNDMKAAFGDLDALPCIGKGQFGELRVSPLPGKPSQLCVIKCVNKESLLNTWQQLAIRAERDAMLSLSRAAGAGSPRWCPRLHFCVQDTARLYFVMEFEPGGDMHSLLYACAPFSEEVAAFYLAELALALNTLHETGYAHRDVKPTNIVLDRFGHLRLVDFGAAKLLSEANPAHELVGTPEYIAPEVYAEQAYTHKCDWWSFGVCAYEMLLGINPFRCEPESRAETKARVTHWRQTLTFPDTLSEAARSLLSSLLESENQRLGFSELRSHPFFHCINWEALNTCEVSTLPCESGSSVGLLHSDEEESKATKEITWACCCRRSKKRTLPVRKNIRQVPRTLSIELDATGRPTAPWRPNFNPDNQLDTRWFGNFR